MIVGDLTITDVLEFQRQSRALDLLAKGDYTPIKQELARAFPRTDLPVRAIPFVQRYVAELSGCYSRAVVRRFGPANLPTATWQTLQRAYEASRIDRALDAAEQALWVQGTVLLLVLPDGLGQVRVQHIAPWQVEDVEVADAMRADDPRYWRKVTIAVPAVHAAGQTVMGKLTLTPTTAYRQVGGQSVGLYAEDGSHPFGTVPLVAVHRVQPDVGRPLAPVNQAVLNLQVALSLQQADNELIVRNCAFPQRWIKNASMAQLVQEIAVGPDKFVALVRSGDPTAPAPELAVAQGQVPVAELVSFAEHQIRLYTAMLGLDPSAFMRVNTAVTASARLFGAQDRQVIRDRIRPVLAQMETDLLRLVVAVLSLRQPLPVPDDLGVTVQWMTTDPSPDRQSDAQALLAEVGLGVASPADVVAARDGVGHAEALATVKRNLDEARSLGLAVAPQVAQGDAPPPPQPPPTAAVVTA